jgi:hypothetical protein
VLKLVAYPKKLLTFLKEFDKRTPNPHPERHFWEFNRPLVPFGDFWVPNDCVPYLQWLTTKHGNFITNFKLSAGLGGPMLSLLGSVLAAMSRSNLGTHDKGPDSRVEECYPRPYGSRV